MHRKLLFILTMLTMIIGSLSQAAAAASASAASVARARTPASIQAKYRPVTGMRKVPPAPVNLTTVAYAPGTAPARVKLGWTESPVASVTGFVIERATNPSFTTGYAAVTVQPSVRSHTLPGLLRGILYYIRIEAVSATKVSPWTTTIVGTP